MTPDTQLIYCDEEHGSPGTWLTPAGCPQGGSVNWPEGWVRKKRKKKKIKDIKENCFRRRE